MADREFTPISPIMWTSLITRPIRISKHQLSTKVRFPQTDPNPFGEASIIADPLFVTLSTDTAALDFRLKAGSPAINAANAESIYKQIRRYSDNQPENSNAPVEADALGRGTYIQSYYNFRWSLR